MEIEEEDEDNTTLEQLINIPADPSHDEVTTPINITWDLPTTTPISFPKFSTPKRIFVSLNQKQNSETENSTYVFAANLNCNASVLAAADSTNIITIFDTNTWQISAQIKDHTDTINELKFAKTHPDVLFSASSDKTLRLWDVRSKTAGPCYKGEGEYFSLDTDANDSLLASGSSVHVKIWDLRTTKLLNKYDDFHYEDITQIRFHPIQTKILCSGSADGNICIFNIEQDEENALLAGVNTEDSIAKITFFGPQFEFLSVLTHSERFSLWTIEGRRVIDSSTSIDLRSKLSESGQFQPNYFISTVYDSIRNQLYLISGNNEGTIGIFQITRDFKLNLVSLLNSGHTDVIRSFEINGKVGAAITGAEDGCVCVWPSIN